MADLASIFSRLALPRLGQDRARAEGLRSWLQIGSYRLDENDGGQKLVLSDVSPAELMPYISFDYERFALASWESFEQTVSGIAKSSSISWVLLQTYYAAFFAAHALMRSAGEAVVKLEADQVDVIQALSDVTLAPSARVEPGMYLMQIEQAQSLRLRCTLRKQSGNSGAHESFWRSFDVFLNRIADREVADKAPDAQQFVAGVSELQPLFRPHKQWRSPWLSAVRNDINYQHKHGVWRPKDVSRRALEVITANTMRASATVRLDYSLSMNTVAAFASASQYLAILNHEIADFISANSTSVRSFGSTWRRVHKEAARL